MKLLNRAVINKLCVGLIVGGSAISMTYAMPTTPKMTFSATKITATSDHQGSMLNGNVSIHVGSDFQITADKVLVKYVNGNPRFVSEFIIYGNGNLEVGKNITQFTNGVFNPVTKEITAEYMKRVT